MSPPAHPPRQRLHHQSRWSFIVILSSCILLLTHCIVASASPPSFAAKIPVAASSLKLASPSASSPSPPTIPSSPPSSSSPGAIDGTEVDDIDAAFNMNLGVEMKESAQDETPQMKKENDEDDDDTAKQSHGSSDDTESTSSSTDPSTRHSTTAIAHVLSDAYVQPHFVESDDTVNRGRSFVPPIVVHPETEKELGEMRKSKKKQKDEEDLSLLHPLHQPDDHVDSSHHPPSHPDFTHPVTADDDDETFPDAYKQKQLHDHNMQHHPSETETAGSTAAATTKADSKQQQLLRRREYSVLDLTVIILALLVTLALCCVGISLHCRCFEQGMNRCACMIHILLRLCPCCSRFVIFRRYTNEDEVQMKKTLYYDNSNMGEDDNL